MGVILLHYQHVEPWVRDLILSYRGTLGLVRVLQRSVRERCPALKRQSGQIVGLAWEEVSALEEWVAEANQAIAYTEDRRQKAEGAHALDVIRAEIASMTALLEAGEERVLPTDELTEAIRRSQRLTRAAHGFTQAGTVRAALPTRMGASAGQAKDAFPECAFCPARRACYLRDLPLLGEAIGDLTEALEWVERRYLPHDVMLAQDGAVRPKKRRRSEVPMAPAQLLPLADRFGRLAPSPEEVYLSEEEEEKLRERFCSSVGLTNHQWQAVLLCYIDRLPAHVAASIIGCARRGVHRHLARAERKYRAYLLKAAAQDGAETSTKRRAE